TSSPALATGSAVTAVCCSTTCWPISSASCATGMTAAITLSSSARWSLCRLGRRRLSFTIGAVTGSSSTPRKGVFGMPNPSLRDYLQAHRSAEPGEVWEISRAVPRDYLATALALELERRNRQPILYFSEVNGSE